MMSTTCYYVQLLMSVMCWLFHDLNHWKELGLQLGLLYPSQKIDLSSRGRIAS